MGLRTYLPKLLFLLRLVCKYIRRYEDAIRDNLPSDAARTALSAVIVACEAMEVILEEVIPPAN